MKKNIKKESDYCYGAGCSDCSCRVFELYG